MATSDYWYEKDKDSVHDALYPYLAHLKQENNGHTQELLRNHRMYSNQPVTNFGPYAFYRNIATSSQSFDASTLNIISSCVDTLQSRIAGTSRPTVEFVTKSGDWLQRRKAKDLNRFIDGIIYQTKLYDLNRQQVPDAGIYGNGYKHWYKEPTKDGTRVRCERVFPIEIMVDPAEAMLGNPRFFCRTKYITRDKLTALAKKQKWHNTAGIADVSPVGTPSGTSSGGTFTDDIIEVHEAWRLPSYKGAPDGIHCVIIENATLVREKYERDVFPFTTYYYKKKQLGFYGESVASLLVRNQVMINRLLKIVDKSLVSFANPTIWTQPGSQFNADKWTRQIGGVISSVSEPKIMQHQIIPQEVYEHIENIWQKSFQQLGIGQQAASGIKQPGLTAAVAINAVDDIQADRLAEPSLAYEELFVDDMRLAIALMKEIYDDEREYSVQAPTNGGLLSLHWSEISEDLDDEAYVLQANSVSSLPKQVPGKLQYINDMQAMGVIAPFQIPRLISNPDIDAVLDPMMAVQDRIYQIIDRILDHGEDAYEGPDELIDPKQQLTLFLNAYAKAQYDGAPDDRLQLLSQYISQLKDILAPPPPPVPAPGMGPPGMPPPGAPPPGAPGPSQAPVAPQAATLAPA